MVVNGINVENLDRSVSPKENFYRFANGGWLKRNPIPPSYSRWGSFEELNEKSNEQLRAILEQSVSASNADPNHRAVAILYATGMDEKKCAAAGLTPLHDVFDAIDAVANGDDVLRLSAALRSKYGVPNGLLAVYSVPDAKNATWEVVELSQSEALGMGDRDFYFRDDREEIRDKYVEHVARMFMLAGFCKEKDAKDIAAEHMKLETKMAESCMTKTDLRDPVKTYNKCEGIEALVEKTKADKELPWADFFETLGVSKEACKTIILDNPAFFTNLNTLLSDTPIDTWKAYMRYHVMKRMANFLSPQIKDEEFSFFGKTMIGQLELKPRWKRVVNTGVTDMLEDSLGMLYTERHFNAAAKKACLDMVHVLTNVLRKQIDEVDWMQDATKEKAKQKLDQFRPMIGYPDKWDVDDIPELLEKISMDKTFCENVRACNVRNFRKIMERVDKPVDPGRWEMPSTLVNAYFHPLKNVIVFPAAILQPPFFFHPTEDSPHGDPAVNFSAIGTVICHEIT